MFNLLRIYREEGLRVRHLLQGRVFDRPELKATMIIDAADALTHRWFVDAQGVPATSDELTQELQQMLHSYLQA